MGQGCIDFEGFVCDALLGFGFHVLKGAHIVQAIDQFDEHDANIFDHRQQHFAIGFGLSRLAALVGQLVDLGDAVD